MSAQTKDSSRLQRVWTKFRALLISDDPRWTPRERAHRVSLSVAFGLSSVFIPLPGVQTPVVLPLAILLKLNIPLVYALNWMSNPVTVPPILFLSYRIGSIVSPPSSSKDAWFEVLLGLFTRVRNGDIPALSEWQIIQEPVRAICLGSLPLMGVTFVLAYLFARALLGRFLRTRESAAQDIHPSVGHL